MILVRMLEDFRGAETLDKQLDKGSTQLVTDELAAYLLEHRKAEPAQTEPEQPESKPKSKRSSK